MQEIIKLAKEKLESFDIDGLHRDGILPKNDLFVPTIYYPPTNMLPETDADEMFGGLKYDGKTPLTVYLHIPFCINRCVFCALGISTTRSPEEKDHYLTMLEKEVDLFLNKYNVDHLPVRSALIGGGTPTYLSIPQLKRFFAFFDSKFHMKKNAQISWDVDVTTLLGDEGMERLQLLKSHGVERLTIGIQSFDDGILKRMNRSNNAKEGLEAIKNAQKLGFKINIDLIYGYLGQTVKQWIETVQTSISAGVDEVQMYRLKVVPFGREIGKILDVYKQKPEEFIPLDDDLLMKEAAILLLRQNGYSENLTRVFTKTEDDYSRYTRDMCCYLLDTAGFGVTSSSSYSDRFFQNARTIEQYYSIIDKGELPVAEGRIRTTEEQRIWAFIMPLKNWHVSKNQYKKLAGGSVVDFFHEKIEYLKGSSLIDEDKDKYWLTERGRFFADEVCQYFYQPEYLPRKEIKGRGVRDKGQEVREQRVENRI